MQHKMIDLYSSQTKTTGHLATYILESSESVNQGKTRPAVLICPGGGYERTSVREAEPVAIQMNSMGFHAFILYYSCAPAVFPAAQLEAAEAIKLIREHAAEWRITEDKIIIAGFSAGGHLAASIGTFWNREFLYQALGAEARQIQPNGMVLCYPVITSGEYAHRRSFENLLGARCEDAELLELVSLEKQVTKDVPQTFLWHTYEDQSVPLENTLLFANALRKCQIPMEVHIYPRGGHGIALANEETQSMEGGNTIIPEAQNWIRMVGKWIRNL